MNKAKSNPRRRQVLMILLVLIISALGPRPQVWAAEFGTGLYVLGYQSSMAGYLPDPGFYLRNDLYFYQGNADILLLSGKVELELRSRAIYNLTSATYVTPWKILGANYAAGAIWSGIGNVFLKGALTTPKGTLTREGDYTGVGDLVVSPIILGWHLGQVHLLFMGNFYAPVGAYNAARRLNTGLNRWAVEPNVALTWLQPKYGQEFSLSMGYTVNFRNPATAYTTGNEFHLEFFLGQHLPKGFALGLAGYVYQQVSADHGAGAKLGAFHGQTIAVGPCATYNGKIGGHPVGLNVRYYNELKVINRADGQALIGTLSLGF